MAAMEILYRLSGFRGEDVLEIDKPEERIAYGGLDRIILSLVCIYSFFHVSIFFIWTFIFFLILLLHTETESIATKM